MFGYIYKIVNKINGETYVGQTEQVIYERFKQHCNNKKGKSLIYFAIQKYGKENFYIMPIDFAENKYELDEKEKYYIKLMDTFHPNGYNLTTGGRSTTYSKLTIDRMSDAHKGKTIPKCVVEKILNSKYGKTYEDIKISAAKSGPRSGQYKGVTYCKRFKVYKSSLIYDGKLYTFGSYDNEVDAAKAYDLGVIMHRSGVGYLNFPNDVDLNAFNKKIIKRKQLTTDIKPNYKNKTSTYKGVTYDKSRNLWQVRLYCDGKKVLFKRLKCEIAAALIYDWAVRKYFGPDAYINFPELEGLDGHMPAS